MPLNDILNVKRISEDLYTSGQPTAEQFQAISEAGFEAVINIAMPTSDNALENEGFIVTDLGMTYLHIPVVWEQPTKQQFELFATLLSSLKEKRLWIHCAMNYRVSAFMYRYFRDYLNAPKDVATGVMFKDWKPDEVWLKFLNK